VTGVRCGACSTAERCPRSCCGDRRGSGRRRSHASSPGCVDATWVELSAVTAGVKDVRRALDEGRGRLELRGRRTLLFIDEIHRFNKAQQDALLPGVEAGWVTLVGATTENPFFELNAPLLSRCQLVRLEPLRRTTCAPARACRRRPERGLAGRVSLTDDALSHLAAVAEGDARAALSALEVAASAAGVHGPSGTLFDGPPSRGRARSDRARRRGGRGRAAAVPLRPRVRRSLRPGVRVHQVDARLGPRRGRLLADPHARSGGGPALPRAPHGHPRLGGRRTRGPQRAALAVAAFEALDRVGCPRPATRSPTRRSRWRSHRSRTG
jgi:hypothetical protein